MWKHLFGVLFVATVVTVTSLAFATNEKTYDWGFAKSKNGAEVDVGAELNDMLERHGSIYKGNPNEKKLYITFDNGYENGYTESILQTLRDEKVPATFFLTGHYLTSATDLVKTMIKDGHIIGNHSDRHPNMAKLTADGMRAEWQNFDTKLRELTGIERTTYARPPEGTFNERVLQVGNEYGYRHIFWSVAFKDWLKDSTAGADYAYNELMAQLHPGAIILMHTVAKHNALALPQFIRDAKAQGYTFHSLDELVADYEARLLQPN